MCNSPRKAWLSCQSTRWSQSSYSVCSAVSGRKWTESLGRSRGIHWSSCGIDWQGCIRIELESRLGWSSRHCHCHRWGHAGSRSGHSQVGLLKDFRDCLESTIPKLQESKKKSKSLARLLAKTLTLFVHSYRLALGQTALPTNISEDRTVTSPRLRLPMSPTSHDRRCCISNRLVYTCTATSVRSPAGRMQHTLDRSGPRSAFRWSPSCRRDTSCRGPSWSDLKRFKTVSCVIHVGVVTWERSVPSERELTVTGVRKGKLLEVWRPTDSLSVITIRLETNHKNKSKCWFVFIDRRPMMTWIDETDSMFFARRSLHRWFFAKRNEGN